MARLRSPGYPNFPLQDVIEMARKIHNADRQHPVAREVAATHMGFSGLTGASDRALSALMHFGLAEKSGKGEIRVTGLALRIIHHESPAEEREALREAAFLPDLFRELRQRYQGQPPSLSSLTSYLSRENFAPAAITPAARAYLKTCEYLTLMGAYESDGDGDEKGPESGPSSQNRLEPTVQASHGKVSSHDQAPPPPAALGYRPDFVSASQRSDVFTIGADGEVVVSLPSFLTQESYDDLKDWLDLIGRKAKRKIAVSPSAAPQPDQEPKES